MLMKREENITMKKLISLLLVLSLALCAVSFAAADETEYRVAMITDYGDITDQSFNQTTYEACKAFCEANGIKFNYYKPTGDSTAERVAKVDAAVEDGYNVIVMPGFAFGATIAEVQDVYPDVKFIALDVSAENLGDGVEVGSNVYCAVYQEELCGYMAGYAAVKLGYKHLGFLGGMAVPAVVRYGYGFVQGADAAAKEIGATDVKIEYGYGNQFYGDADITAVMDTWYQTLGVQVVFACGGAIYTSAADAAVKVEGAKVIGVDVDQAGLIDSTYGEGLTLTSAMKGLAATVNTLLTETTKGNFANYGGKVETLGLVSGEDASLNYVGLPESTQWADAFTKDDYNKMVAAMFNGEITVSNAIDTEPAVTAVTVEYHGNVK